MKIAERKLFKGMLKENSMKGNRKMLSRNNERQRKLVEKYPSKLKLWIAGGFLGAAAIGSSQYFLRQGHEKNLPSDSGKV